jgi:peptidyl-prolyl cis-trans isomerase D
MKALKQIFVLLAVVAISMVFVIQFRPGATEQTASGPLCALEINGECVQQSDFVTAYRLAAPPNADDDALKQLRLRQAVVDGLIERWVLLQDAERLGLRVSEEDVARDLTKGLARISLPVARADYYSAVLRLAPMPDGPARSIFVRDRKSGKFDRKRFQQEVRRVSNKTVKAFMDFQREELLAARVRALVRARVRVPEAEAFQAFSRDGEKAVVEYAKLERGFYREYVIDASQDAVDKWASGHTEEIDEAWKSRKDSYLPECRHARHMLVRIDDTSPDKEAAKKAARDKLLAAKKRIEDGAEFADVAREVSEDHSNKNKGGDLGCFGKGRMAKPFEEAAFAMEEGKLSDVVETTYGMHLIKLEKVYKGDEAEKLGKKETARDVFMRQESERIAAEGAKQILAAVRAGKSLEDAIHDHVESVLPKGPLEDYKAGRAKAASADDDEDDKDGEKDDEKGDDEKDDGEKDDSDDEKGDSDEKTTAWSDPLRPRAELSAPFGQNGPPFAGVQSPAEAAKSIFALKKPGDTPDDVIKLYDGYAVAKLKERRSVSKDDWEKERPRYLENMVQERQRDALIEYVQRLREQHARQVSYKIRLTEDSTNGEGSGK